jgi:hypothetical protein
MPSHKEFYDALNNISVNADTLNLNTDQVESKLDTTTGLLTTLSADTAIIKTDMSNGVSISGTVNTYPLQGTSVSNTNFSSITSAEIAPASASREVLSVYNEGAGTLFINVGASCSTTSYQVRLFSGDYWEAPAGQQSLQHSGIFGSSGTARITGIS